MYSAPIKCDNVHKSDLIPDPNNVLTQPQSNLKRTNPNLQPRQTTLDHATAIVASAGVSKAAHGLNPTPGPNPTCSTGLDPTRTPSPEPYPGPHIDPDPNPKAQGLHADGE